MSTSEEMKTESPATAAVAQLRAVVCGLGLAVLVLGLTFDAFVLKKNRELQGTAGNRNRQADQISGMLQQWTPALNDLAQHSAGHPELMAIFKRRGLEISLPAASGTQPATPQP